MSRKKIPKKVNSEAKVSDQSRIEKTNLDPVKEVYRSGVGQILWMIDFKRADPPGGPVLESYHSAILNGGQFLI